MYVAVMYGAPLAAAVVVWAILRATGLLRRP